VPPTFAPGARPRHQPPQHRDRSPTVGLVRWGDLRRRECGGEKIRLHTSGGGQVVFLTRDAGAAGMLIQCSSLPFLSAGRDPACGVDSLIPLSPLPLLSLSSPSLTRVAAARGAVRRAANWALGSVIRGERSRSDSGRQATAVLRRSSLIDDDCDDPAWTAAR
jgi:hypothetical protein